MQECIGPPLGDQPGRAYPAPQRYRRSAHYTDRYPFQRRNSVCEQDNLFCRQARVPYWLKPSVLKGQSMLTCLIRRSSTRRILKHKTCVASAASRHRTGNSLLPIGVSTLCDMRSKSVLRDPRFSERLERSLFVSEAFPSRRDSLSAVGQEERHPHEIATFFPETLPTLRLATSISIDVHGSLILLGRIVLQSSL